MQNHDFHIGNGRSDLASGCSAGYRVMARGRDGRIALFSLAGGRNEAVPRLVRGPRDAAANTYVER